MKKIIKIIKMKDERRIRNLEDELIRLRTELEEERSRRTDLELIVKEKDSRKDQSKLSIVRFGKIPP